MVLLYAAGVAVDGRVPKYHDHDSVSAVQLHDVCRVSLHRILLAVPDHSGCLRTPGLAVYVKDPQLICDIAVSCFNSASIHKDVFLQVKMHTSVDSGDSSAPCKLFLLFSTTHQKHGHLYIIESIFY